MKRRRRNKGKLRKCCQQGKWETKESVVIETTSRKCSKEEGVVPWKGDHHSCGRMRAGQPDLMGLWREVISNESVLEKLRDKRLETAKEAALPGLAQ